MRPRHPMGPLSGGQPGLAEVDRLATSPNPAAETVLWQIAIPLVGAVHCINFGSQLGLDLTAKIDLGRTFERRNKCGPFCLTSRPSVVCLVCFTIL